jgi:hypothetical protein
MRIYDIALVIMRTSAVIEFIRAAFSVFYTAVRFAFLAGAFSDPGIAKMELARWLSPIEMFLIGVALLILSKPAARFAARFARDSDTASHF